MKRWLLLLLLVPVGWYGGRALVHAFAGDETRIRWCLEGEAAAFNDAALLSALAAFADDYRDRTLGIDRQQLRAAVLWAFQNRRDSATGRFRLRVAFDPGQLVVEIDGDRATAHFPLQLYEGLDAAEQLRWGLQVDADLQRRDGGWQITGSQHTTTAGGRPR